MVQTVPGSTLVVVIAGVGSRWRSSAERSTDYDLPGPGRASGPVEPRVQSHLPGLSRRGRRRWSRRSRCGPGLLATTDGSSHGAPTCGRIPWPHPLDDPLSRVHDHRALGREARRGPGRPPRWHVRASPPPAMGRGVDQPPGAGPRHPTGASRLRLPAPPRRGHHRMMLLAVLAGHLFDAPPRLISALRLGVRLDLIIALRRHRDSFHARARARSPRPWPARTRWAGLVAALRARAPARADLTGLSPVRAGIGLASLTRDRPGGFSAWPPGASR